MKQVKIVAFCDSCDFMGNEHEVDTLVVNGLWEADFCDECANQLLTAFRPTQKDKAKPKAKPKAKLLPWIKDVHWFMDGTMFRCASPGCSYVNTEEFPVKAHLGRQHPWFREVRA